VLAVVATAVAALSGAVWAGTFWASYADGPPRSRPLAELAPVATTTPLPPMPISPTSAANGVGAAPVDWTQVLADLDSRREEAFGNDDPDGLTDVDAPGSPVLASDRAALEAMAAAGVDAAGFREIIDSVRPLAVSAGGVLLRVVDERPAYALVRVTDGAVVASRPARAARAWQVALVRGAAGWQVRDVRPSG
jgi:hypothetical protein